MSLAPADLSGCAAEPIRTPGAIQPHGWLAAFDARSGRLQVRSDNWHALTGATDEAGTTAAAQALLDGIRSRTDGVVDGACAMAIGSVFSMRRRLDATCHRTGPSIVVELEPANASGGRTAPPALGQVLAQMEQAQSVPALTRLAAARMKALTGFGRCLVYSFDAHGHGTVLAEQCDPEYASYAGHRFPGSDIPLQARTLYLLNRIRVIPDAIYVPVPLQRIDGAGEAPPLDLSQAHLRSVSPVHLEYMRNMGTLASMSVSIVVRGRLWGLVSCHNHAPRGLDQEARAACDQLGRLLSLHIEHREAVDDVQARHAARGLAMQIVSRLGNSTETLQDLVDDPAALLAFTESTGAAVVFGAQCWTVGEVPAEPRLLALAAWLEERNVGIFATQSLVAENAPPIGNDESDGSGSGSGSGRSDDVAVAGLLALSLSDDPVHQVLWFRPELVRSVRWAGEDTKQADMQARLHPRRSFESWEQTVRGESAPWTANEILGVTELRQLLTDIVLRHARERAEAADRLSRVTLARDSAERADSDKTHFLAVLSHELRTPLSSISNAAELLERYAVLPPKFSSLVPMIKRNVALETRLINDLLDMSAITARKLKLSIGTVDIHQVVRLVDDMLRPETVAKSQQLEVDLRADPSMIPADPVRMQQVLWNLLRNAIKFTPPGGRIRIESELIDGELVLRCIDTGIGIHPDALERIFTAFEQIDQVAAQPIGGLGLGLAIATGIVLGHGGLLTASSDGPGLGATFTVHLPLVEPASAPTG